MTTSNTTSTRKPTKRDHFNALLAIPEVSANADLVEFINHELELLSRKNTNKDGEKKMTDRQKENAAIAEKVYDFMESGVKYTISALLKTVPDLPEDMTNQRLSRLVNDYLVPERVIKSVEKRVTYFTLAE